MNTNLFAACAVAALLLVGTGGAMAAGFDAGASADRGWSGVPQPADDEASETDTERTATGDQRGAPPAGPGSDTVPPYDQSESDESESDETDGENDADERDDAENDGDTGAPFTVVAEDTEECGKTCRDVTSTVTNHQNATAEDVTVSTRIYAGKGTNAARVWHGSEDVGSLSPSGSHTATARIELSLGDAISVKRADGWITIETTVETDDQAVTLTEQRQVA